MVSAHAPPVRTDRKQTTRGKQSWTDSKPCVSLLCVLVLFFFRSRASNLASSFNIFGGHTRVRAQTPSRLASLSSWPLLPLSRHGPSSSQKGSRLKWIQTPTSTTAVTFETTETFFHVSPTGPTRLLLVLVTPWMCLPTRRNCHRTQYTPNSNSCTKTRSSNHTTSNNRQHIRHPTKQASCPFPYPRPRPRPFRAAVAITSSNNSRPPIATPPTAAIPKIPRAAPTRAPARTPTNSLHRRLARAN